MIGDLIYWIDTCIIWLLRLMFVVFVVVALAGMIHDVFRD